MDKVLKILKLAGIGAIVAVVAFGYWQYQKAVSYGEKEHRRVMELTAQSMPTHAKADTIIVFQDSIAIAERDRHIHELQVKILSYARTPAETVEVQTYVEDSLSQTISDAGCTKTIRGEYLYRTNGIAAYIAATAFCATDKMEFDVGGYAEPIKPPFLRFDNVTGALGYDGKGTKFSGAASFAIRDKFLFGPAIIDNAVGVNFGLRF
jgi:hypothetical protein